MYIENKTLSPCKECTERSIGCHSECVKYKIYRTIRRHNGKRINKYINEYSDKAANRKPSLWNIYYKSKKK